MGLGLIKRLPQTLEKDYFWLHNNILYIYSLVTNSHFITKSTILRAAKYCNPHALRITYLNYFSSLLQFRLKYDKISATNKIKWDSYNLSVYSKLFCRQTITWASIVWFDSLLPINNLSVIKGTAFLGWTCTKLGLTCLAQGHNTVTPVRLEPEAPQSWVKHSTTGPHEPVCDKANKS